MGDSPERRATTGTGRRFRWLRAAGDRVPTKWFASIGAGAFLVATAAFGGMATAREPGPVPLAAGEPYRGAQFELTVERAVLLDELSAAGVIVEPGQRVLGIVLEAENRWTEPIASAATGGLATAVSIEALPGEPPASIARYDDATVRPWLQPGVPARLAVVWAVDADRFADGERIRVVVHEQTLTTGSFVTSGTSWGDPVAAATVELVIDDVDAGAEPDPDAGADPDPDAGPEAGR
ncbi:hypothetical protein ROT00_17740 [Agromyces mediolanus]|uniref:hypothetical protein n=1 Tax=Agromyces mediolanus TaxID=41986 RepID=UPI003836F1B6